MSTKINLNGIQELDLVLAGTTAAAITTPGQVTVTNTLPTATTSVAGIVKPDGTSIGISAGTVSVLTDVPFTPPIKTVTVNYTVLASDYTMRADATSSIFTITLPLSPVNGMVVCIKKIDSSVNAVTISGNGHNIDGSSTKVLSAQYAEFTLQYCTDDNTWGIY